MHHEVVFQTSRLKYIYKKKYNDKICIFLAAYMIYESHSSLQAKMVRYALKKNMLECK